MKAMRAGRVPAAPGFTLLEVMVATVIVGISLGAICCAMAQVVRGAGVTCGYTRALMLARGKLDEVLLRERLETGRERGRFPDEPGYAWRLAVEPGGERGLLRVRVTVSFNGPGGVREVELQTLRAERALAPARDGAGGERR